MQKKTRTTIKILIAIIALLIFVEIGYAVYTMMIVPGMAYKEAAEQLESGNFDVAIEQFEDLGDYKDAQTKVKEDKYRMALDYMENEEY